VVDFEARVGRWIQAQLGKDDAPHPSIDGKTARGSRDGDTPGVHLLSGFAPDVKAVLARLRVDAKTNEHKAALEILGVIPVKDKIITGDAMFTHRDFCAKVVEGGGDYVLPVKENQPTLRKDIAAAFAEPEAGLSLPTDRATRGRNRRGTRDRQGARPNRDSVDLSDLVDGRVSGTRLA
jgi:predicted transposase YbfD/YdcC